MHRPLGTGAMHGQELAMPTNSRREGGSPFADVESLLDETNLRLLAELQGDPRISMSELARRVGMSAPAVTERFQRLVRRGVITGFRMDVDPAAVGLPVAAFTRIRPVPGQLARLAELAASIPQVSEC